MDSHSLSSAPAGEQAAVVNASWARSRHVAARDGGGEEIAPAQERKGRDAWR